MSTDTSKMSDYAEPKDSLNLKVIDGKSFTVVKWEKSDYNDSPGIKIHTEEPFEGLKKLHTTRMVVVEKFYKIVDEKVVPTVFGKAINEGGKKFHLKVIKVPGQTGKNDYYDLVDAEPITQENLG